MPNFFRLDVLDYDLDEYVKYSHVVYSVILATLFSCLHISFFLLLVFLALLVSIIYLFLRCSYYALYRNKFGFVLVDSYAIFKGFPKLLPSLTLFSFLLLGLIVSSLITSIFDVDPSSWFIALFALMIFRQMFASLELFSCEQMLITLAIRSLELFVIRINSHQRFFLIFPVASKNYFSEFAYH